jgi:archaellum component FlaC
MPGFNPETAGGDNQNLIEYLGIISENCRKILAMIAGPKKRNGSNRLSLNVESAQTAANAISAAATGFLRELESKIDINQESSLEENIRALTAEVMTLQSLLETQEVNVDAIEEQVKSIINIVNKIKNTLKRSH